MEAAFDPQTFLRQRTGGISRLFTDLAKGFEEDPSYGVNVTLPFTWVNNEYLASDVALRDIRKVPSWLPREALYAPWILRGLRVPRGMDIVHHTYYSSRFLGDTRGAARVVTVYDMIPEKFAGTSFFTGSHLAKEQYVRRSDLIICISESTQRDLYEIYGDIDAVVRVVPLAVSSLFAPQQEPLALLPSEYIIYVGKRSGYKNFSLLIDAMSIIKSHGVDIKTVVVGPPFSESEEEYMRALGVRDRFQQVALDDASLARAYANASLLVQTSSYEGFGMTPLEAMASGIPVLVAEASSMPEVGGRVAQYFDPGSLDSLVSQLELLMGADSMRRRLGAEGLERARLFTPGKMLERTARAYSDVV